MKKEKKQRGRSRPTEDKQVKDSNELLMLIRHQMAQRRAGPEENRPKELEIPEPE